MIAWLRVHSWGVLTLMYQNDDGLQYSRCMFLAWLQQTHSNTASPRQNYRPVMFLLFWVNTFSGYLGNTLNKSSPESLALLSAPDPPLSLIIPPYIFHHPLPSLSRWKISLSFHFWSLYPFWEGLVHNVWMKGITLKRLIHRDHKKDNHPHEANIQIAAGKKINNAAFFTSVDSWYKVEINFNSLPVAYKPPLTAQIDPLIALVVYHVHYILPHVLNNVIYLY